MSTRAKHEHAVDACRPILIWEPACAHEGAEDCEHTAIWVATRVTRDTLALGTMELEVREFDDDDLDDFEDVTVSSGIAAAYALETGALTPLEVEGKLFLRHHPWLAERLRTEVDFFGRRAARAAAQLDRETQPRNILSVLSHTMIAYHELFPADWDLVPIHDGKQYWAVDLYCRNPDCTCTSSVINFYDMESESRLVGEVVVDYGDGADREIEAEPSNESVDAIFDTLWNACEYKLRARHVRAHEAVQRFAPRAAPMARAAHVPREPPASPRSVPIERVPRNATCPCGSGKKFKRCCLDAPCTRGPRP